MLISTSGYYSTGSSAAFVLLKEYDTCSSGILEQWDIKSHEYENIFLYTPNGVFDLEDKLLIGNSIHRSDEALRSFRSEMKRLNDNRYIWCGDFQRLMGDSFMKAVDAFIEELTMYELPGHWEYHYGDNRFNLRKFLGSIRRTLTGQPIIGHFYKWVTFRTDAKVYYSFPTPEEYYEAAGRLIDAYRRGFLGPDMQDKNLILNHFILPHNLFRLPNYFGEDDIRVVVVDRDPRDVFVMEKYRTRSDHSLLPCDDVKDFVAFWKLLRERERKLEDKRIVRLRFEDMIYRYEDTLRYLEEKCNLSEASHVYKKQFFSPEKSKYNTQLFLHDSKWADEVAYIERELAEYLYPFPEDSGVKEKLGAEQYGIYVC